MRQLALLSEKKYPHRKTVRPISLRGGNHVVLKSVQPVLRAKHREVREAIAQTQQRFGAKLKAIAVMPDHVHLVIKVDSRSQFANTLKMLASLIAKRVVKGKLWAKRAWSRPLSYGRDLATAITYVARNSIKARCFRIEDTFFIIDGRLRT